MSILVSPEGKRKCSACGERQSGRLIYPTLMEKTHFQIPIIGRPDPKSDRIIETGETFAVQGFGCLECGHIDFYAPEIIPPHEKRSGLE